MVKLRLRRMGRKQRPVYDIVAADSRNPRDGRFIEKLGQYNPMVVADQVTLKRDRVLYWLQTGAQPTDTVRSILGREGLLLELHMNRKGKDKAEIAQSVENHVARKQNRESQNVASVEAAAEKRRHDEEEAARAREAAIEEAARAKSDEETAAAAEAASPRTSATEEAIEAAEAGEGPTSIQELPDAEAEANA